MNFVLVQDSVSANFIRSELASQGALKIKVGNFQALLETLQELWILPKTEDRFREALRSNALKMSQAFWAESIKVDEVSVLAQLEQTVRQILNFSPAGELPASIAAPQSRHEYYFNDLLALISSLDALPNSHQIVTQWLQFVDEINKSIVPLNLYFPKDWVQIEPWQKPVIDRLLASTKSAVPPTIESAFLKLDQLGSEEYTHLGSQLFNEVPPQKIPAGFLGVTCRDGFQESQFVANCIAKLIAAGTQPDQIALYYPANFQKLDWLKAELHAQGIAVSNLPEEKSVYDWQTQLLRDLIRLQLEEVPPMAYCSVLANPLMPWANAHQLNRILNQDKHSGSVAAEFSKALYPLLQQSISSAQELIEWLLTVGEYLEPKNQLGLTLNRWKSLVGEIQEAFAFYEMDGYPLQCQKVLNQLTVGEFVLSHEKSFYLNSVLAISSNEILPKPVDHLFIIGFNEGHYSLNLSQMIPCSILDLPSWQSLGFEQSLQDQFAFQKHLLKTNLSKISTSLTVSASRQNFDGSKLELSELALDLALCFQSPQEVNPQSLFTNFDHLTDELLSWEYIDVTQIPKREPQDLQFQEDLLALHTNADNERRPESPSSLSKMMISPLDWLMNRQGIEDTSWQIQTLDIMIQGTIAHKVFELYKDCQPEVFSETLLDELYLKALQVEAPFILQPHWRLERIQLRQEIKRALQAFIEWLSTENWQIDQVEQRLKGTLWEIPITGFADAILEMESSILVLDYKKSKSDDRVKQLQNGFDLQTYIYRQLLAQKTETAQDSEKDKEKDKVIHSGYYTLNDQTLVLDQASNSNTQISIKVPDCQLDEQSKAARKVIEQRLLELAKGFVALNRSGDESRWKAVGVKFYALENNAILKRFMISEEQA